MRKRDKKVEQPCYTSCRNRHNDLCIRLPSVGLVSHNIYQLTNPNDPDSGTYVNNSYLQTKLPQICPFAKPKKPKKEKDEDEFSNPSIKEQDGLGLLVREGLMHFDGVVVAGIYTALTAAALAYYMSY